MGLGRLLLCIILPPLAVFDKGVKHILIVVLLTLIGWVPGVIAAIIICHKTGNRFVRRVDKTLKKSFKRVKKFFT